MLGGLPCGEDFMEEKRNVPDRQTSEGEYDGSMKRDSSRVRRKVGVTATFFQTLDLSSPESLSSTYVTHNALHVLS
jgi:hypothetical protein